MFTLPMYLCLLLSLIRCSGNAVSEQHDHSPHYFKVINQVFQPFHVYGHIFVKFPIRTGPARELRSKPLRLLRLIISLL